MCRLNRKEKKTFYGRREENVGTKPPNGRNSRTGLQGAEKGKELEGRIGVRDLPSPDKKVPTRPSEGVLSSREKGRKKG